ncbi:MAG: HYR domain-containing protein [Verrucomicrobiales bacterium]|nr:HYR domain-containing protein [Verrucomicrobiales bacterium]
MKKLLFTIVSAVCLAVSALAQDGLFINVDPETKTYYVSGTATGVPEEDSFHVYGIFWDNFQVFSSDDYEEFISPLVFTAPPAFTVTGNSATRFAMFIHAAGNVNGPMLFPSGDQVTLTGNSDVLLDYSNWSPALIAELEQKASDGETVSVTRGSPEFALTFRTAGLFINVDPVTKTYFLSGTATGVPSVADGHWVIHWNNGQPQGSPNFAQFGFLSPNVFTIAGNSRGIIYDSQFHQEGLVNHFVELTSASQTTLIGNPAEVRSYSGWSSSLIAELEQKASDGETVDVILGSPSFALTFRLAPSDPVDTEPPTIAVPDDIGAVASSTDGAVVNFSVFANDAVDGSVPVICDPPSGSLFPPGATTVTCIATDAAGNSATETFVVWVSYAWSGILQPINADGSSVFKAGRTVPVKFQLTGASTGIADLTATLSSAKISDSVTGPVNEATASSASTAGSLFRYDPVEEQYIFNWNTKGLSPGTYQLRIDLGDEVEQTLIVSLR